MSLKPLKISDQRKKQEKINAKMEKRKKELIDEPPPYMYIVSEGTRTEPNYIRGLSKSINSKYSDLSSGNCIVVKGTGRNTKGLLAYAKKQVEREFPQAEVVWLMYDKDDFPIDDFDNTQYSADNRKNDNRLYKTAWSNECIELWFVLHFQELTVNNEREQYQKILKQACGYQKNLENLYELLKDNTDIAIKRARSQYKSYGDVPPSKKCPATRVYELVEELKKYL